MPRKILIIGMMGSGKTTVGRIVAKKMKLKHIDIDIYIEKEQGKRVSELFAISEKHFRELETKACSEISLLEDVVVSSGGGIVLNEENMRYFDDFVKVHINRSVKLILATVNRENRPLLHNGDDLFIEQYFKRQPLYNKYKNIEVVSDSTPYHCARKIIRKLNHEKSNGN